MFRVLDVFKIGETLSVTLNGNGEMIRNGSKLADNNGRVYTVVSVGMTKHNNLSDISKITNVLIVPCDLEKGERLFIV